MVFVDMQQIPNSSKSLAMMFVVALFITAIDLPRIVRYDYRAFYPQPDHLEPAIRYLEENTVPGDYLLSDDVMIPYLANRLVPPSAINLTFAATFKFDQKSGTYLEDNASSVSCRWSHRRRPLSAQSTIDVLDRIEFSGFYASGWR